jgi:predicted metal-binding protein
VAKAAFSYKLRGMLDGKELVRIALESNASHAAILNAAEIQLYEDVRKACEQNFCRKYDTNWMGPPAIGPISELGPRVRSYRQGLLFQTVHQLTSSFDMEGWGRAAGIHNTIFRALLEKIRAAYPAETLLALNAGCCSVCERCGYVDQQPCRNPEQAVSSVEAYGMNVLSLQKSAGVPYNNGKNTVTYVGLILFDKI